MIIGGLEKISLIDYAPKLSCVIFTMGCNFRCPYCHNAQLVLARETQKLIDEKLIFEFLEKRKMHLDGVVITGGEPTLQPDLPDFAARIKEMGFLVKLDTNGSNPSRLLKMISLGLLDYIAMDIKTDPARYTKEVGAACSPKDIVASAHMIIESGLKHEFRTTCVTPIINSEAIKTIAKIVSGADQYALQSAHMDNILEPDFFAGKNRCSTEDEMEEFKQILSPAVKTCVIR
ncbi:MAG: anaerobic ribonucleoside-triphosphate reductase activating protein [Deltaproteobacteria bacterium]|nr:anaerobic ribonucleoside-triphosphate reductase activating protein [Deltaproteobacteria bacterium]